MTITRRPKVCQDFPLGIVEVNAAIDNNAGLFEAWDLRHCLTKANVTQVNLLKWFGRHDDTVISRTVGCFSVDRSGISPILSGIITGPAIARTERIGVGQWRIYFTGLSTVWVQADVAMSAGVTLTPYTMHVSAYVESGMTSCIVSTAQLVGSAFVLSDLSFSISIHGELG